MNIAIDASNIINESGGFVHLQKLLENFNNRSIEKIYVFTSKKTIKSLKIKNKKIILVDHSFLNKERIHKILWKVFILNQSIKNFDCSILFVLSGYFFLKKIPTFLIIQNLLPFMKKPKYQEKIITKIKNFLLNNIHKISILRASGVIFLSKYSKDMFKNYSAPKIVIPHGVEKQFFFKKKNKKKPKKFKILYLSKIETYKNHLNIVRGFHEILKEGINANLTLVGSKDPDYLKSSLYQSIKSINNEFPKSIIVKKLVKHKLIHKIYRKFDLHVFGSMCESFGIIILETIASSLPIVSNNFPVFKEILGKNTIYFDAEDPKSIFKSIKEYIYNSQLKNKNTNNLYQIAKKYNWKNTSDKTFKFIIKNYVQNKK